MCRGSLSTAMRPNTVTRANFLALGIRPRLLSSVSPAFTLSGSPRLIGRRSVLSR